MALIIVLSVIGITAILAELVLPGGVLGVIGAGCLIAAVVATFMEYGVTAGVVATFLLLVLGFATLAWWMKYFHRLPVTRKLILENESGKKSLEPSHAESIGVEGVALTDLVPSGHVSLRGKRTDAIAESGFISKDATVRVVAVRGPAVVVRPIDDIPVES